MSKYVCLDHSLLLQDMNNSVHCVICLNQPMNSNIKSYLDYHTIEILSMSEKNQLFVKFDDKNCFAIAKPGASINEQEWVAYIFVLPE